MRPSSCALCLFLSYASAIPHSRRAASQSQLIIADTGVGHRSVPVPEWRTSLRRISTDGSSPSIIEQWGTIPPAEPIGAAGLTIDHKSQYLYTATGNGIVRTAIDGSKNTTLISDSASFVALSKDKIYYGLMTEGLIKHANLDGSNAEVFLNVSNGLNFDYVKYTPSYTPANNYPDNAVIDEKNNLIYWSSSTTDPNNVSNGSIRRAPLKGQGTSVPANVEVLVENIQMPGQLRFVNDYLYWVEKGRWSDSPTYIRRAKFANTHVSRSITADQPDTIVSSKQSSSAGVFSATDVVGDKMTLSIQSFAVDEGSKKLWFAMMSDARTMFAKVVETSLDGGDLKVLNANTTDIGIPVGLEYVK